MSDVKWIKITTNMFDDEKVNFIESLPEADTIIVIWMKLLTLAGRINANGYIFLTEKIPYTDEMLSHKFRRSLNTIKLAFNTLEKLDMINFDNEGFIKIANWEKHQNIQGLEKIREQNRVRQAKFRENQKSLPNSNVTVTLRNGTDKELDKELDIDIEEDTRVEEPLSKYQIIIDTWNELQLAQIKSINSNRLKMVQARIKEFSVDEILQAIEIIKNSSFLKGQNKNNWIITFDWFIKPNNFIKVLEGNYLDKEVQNGFHARISNNGKGEATPYDYDKFFD